MCLFRLRRSVLFEQAGLTFKVSTRNEKKKGEREKGEETWRREETSEERF